MFGSIEDEGSVEKYNRVVKREREKDQERGREGGRAYLFNNLCLVSTVSYYLVSTNERNLHIRITVYERGMCVCAHVSLHVSRVRCFWGVGALAVSPQSKGILL